MKIVIVFALAILIIGALTAKKAPKGRRKKHNLKYDPKGDWPFISKDVMTATEENFFKVLVEALPEHTVLAQVGLSRVLEVKKGHDFSAWFNRINRMSLDYLIIDKEFKTVAAVELDDPSHNTKSAQERDARKNKALQAGGIKLIRWHVKEQPNKKEIREMLGLEVSESVANNQI